MINESSVFNKANDSVKTSPAFGIDLGTTNSCISVLRKGTLPEIIPMRDGSHTLPSCVMYKSKDGKVVVGREAYENRHLPNVVYSSKRKMGSDEKIKVDYAHFNQFVLDFKTDYSWIGSAFYRTDCNTCNK